jgi:hypothetical protein
MNPGQPRLVRFRFPIERPFSFRLPHALPPKRQNPRSPTLRSLDKDTLYLVFKHRSRHPISSVGFAALPGEAPIEFLEVSLSEVSSPQSVWRGLTVREASSKPLFGFELSAAVSDAQILIIPILQSVSTLFFAAASRRLARRWWQQAVATAMPNTDSKNPVIVSRIRILSTPEIGKINTMLLGFRSDTGWAQTGAGRVTRLARTKSSEG